MGELRFIWRAGACAPEESAWSRVQKFAYLNGFDRSDLGRIVANVRGGNRTAASMHLSVIRRTPATETLLSVVTGQDDEPLDVCWLWPEALKLLPGQSVTSHLRFCSTCADVGFHTALFQLQSSICCPIHNLRIQDACPQCGDLIPYSVQGATLENPYGCRCGRLIWSGRDSSAWQGISRADTSVLEEWRSWRTRLHASSQPRLLGAMSHDRELLERPGQDGDLYKDLAVATSAPLSVRRLVGVPTRRPATVTIIKIDQRVQPTKVSDTKVLTEFRTAYRQFEKTLDRYLSKSHCRCIELFKNLPGWASTSQLRPFCDEIAAVHRWKDYWQKHLRYGWEDSTLVDFLAREVVRTLARDETRAVIGEGILPLRKLAQTYFESTLAIAYRLSRTERLDTYFGTSRAWPGLDQSSWPCWSILTSASGEDASFLIWHPAFTSAWRQIFDSGSAHQRRAQEAFAATQRELENRLKSLTERGISSATPRAK